MNTRKPISLLENEYPLFDDRAVKTADALQMGMHSAGTLMMDMNRMHQVIAGLGVVLRIVGGNSVLEADFEPENPASTPPLSKYAEGLLVGMAAAMCEEMRDNMQQRANAYNAEVQS